MHTDTRVKDVVRQTDGQTDRNIVCTKYKVYKKEHGINGSKTCVCDMCMYTAPILPLYMHVYMHMDTLSSA